MYCEHADLSLFKNSSRLIFPLELTQRQHGFTFGVQLLMDFGDVCIYGEYKYLNKMYSIQYCSIVFYIEVSTSELTANCFLQKMQFYAILCQALLWIVC